MNGISIYASHCYAIKYDFQKYSNKQIFSFKFLKWVVVARSFAFVMGFGSVANLFTRDAEIKRNPRLFNYKAMLFEAVWYVLMDGYLMHVDYRSFEQCVYTHS